LDAVIIAITVIVVAIPEGLPLAVVIALSFASKKMQDLNNMVSADGGFFTKLFKSCIFLEANERAMTTAKGRPSGMATTMTVIAMMTASNNSK
jgi:magnesium-transporting ATPase (P-type)